MKRINALTIAGTDPSGGAGIQADLKTFSALGAYGCSAITALVAQNTRGVQSVYRIEPDFVAAQLDSVFSDVRIDTTKIGMLAETDIVEAVAERLARYRVANVVLDTVMLAKSGDPLLSASAVETLRQRLLPQVSLITPNLPEAAALLDAPHARNEREMLEQGRALLALGCGAVNEGDIYTILGTTCCTGIVCRGPQTVNEATRFVTHTEAGQVISLFPMQAGTPNIDWLQQHISLDADLGRLEQRSRRWSQAAAASSGSRTSMANVRRFTARTRGPAFSALARTPPAPNCSARCLKAWPSPLSMRCRVIRRAASCI